MSKVCLKERKEKQMNDELATKILNTPIECEFEEFTINQYLCELLITLLVKRESFNGKHPFGDSGWENYLLESMAKGGFIEATFDSEGYLDKISKEEEEKTFELIKDVVLYCFGY
jgi:hypothetical protein